MSVAVVTISASVKYQVMPPLTPAEFTELERDIVRTGVINTPIIVDEDGVIIDGHHRWQIAEQHNISPRIVVEPGLTEDEKKERAFALNVHRRSLTPKKKREMIATRLAMTPEKSSRQIAAELGVSPTTVCAARSDDYSTVQSGHLENRQAANGQSHPVEKVSSAERAEQIRALAASGLNVAQIAEELGITGSRVYVICKQHSIHVAASKKTSASVAERWVRVRELAGQNWTSRQIAAEVGITVESLRNGCFQRDIRVPADEVVGRSRMTDARRIVDSTVLDLINIASAVEMFDITGADFDPEELDGWVANLNASMRTLQRFTRQLKEMTQP